ncbi:TrmH family RNA methyltransferase [Pseudomonadota bacterium]
MASRSERNKRRQSRAQVLERYEKHRRRNLLAEPGTHQFVVVLDRLKAGFNVPKIFRSAEIFGAHEIHLIDIGPFDPAPAKGGVKNVPARFHDQFDDCYQQLKERGYTFFTLEANSNQMLWEAQLPEKSAFIFGHEEMGICFDKKLYPDIQTLAVPQFGKIESLNVSVAASIVMYEYVRQVECGN